MSGIFSKILRDWLRFIQGYSKSIQDFFKTSFTISAAVVWNSLRFFEILIASFQFIVKLKWKPGLIRWKTSRIKPCSDTHGRLEVKSMSGDLNCSLPIISSRLQHDRNQLSLRSHVETVWRHQRHMASAVFIRPKTTTLMLLRFWINNQVWFT